MPWILSLAVFAVPFLLGNLVQGSEVVQSVEIPHRMPSEGRLPSFEVTVDGVKAGELSSDAILSNGRFFGLRWIVRGEPGWRMEISEGSPYTLKVWHSGTIAITARD